MLFKAIKIITKKCIFFFEFYFISLGWIGIREIMWHCHFTKMFSIRFFFIEWRKLQNNILPYYCDLNHILLVFPAPDLR